MQWHEKLADIIERLDDEELEVRQLRRLDIQVKAVMAHVAITSVQLEYEQLVHNKGIDRRMPLLESYAEPEVERE